MTVYERVQTLGEWSVQLRPEVPKSVRDLITPLTHVVILPGRVYAPRLSDTAVLASALYTGVVLQTPGQSLGIGGPGLGWWLGDANNNGAVLESLVTFSAGSLSTWVTALKPSALAAGTVTSPGGTVGGAYQWVTRRQALDGVCGGFGVEWQITPAFALNVATAATLYSTAPVAIATATGGGSDTALVGLRATVDVEQDYSEYTSKVYVQGPGGAGVSGGASTYRDGQGNLATVVRFVDSRDTPPGSEGAVASDLVNLWSSAAGQRDIRINARRFAITRTMSAGKYLYLYDPRFSFQGTTPVRFQGVWTFPLAVRVMGVRWPIEAPMSVLLRYYSGGSYVYADLSDYVAYESGDATLEVGG